jgi:hypothetical protein
MMAKGSDENCKALLGSACPADASDWPNGIGTRRTALGRRKSSANAMWIEDMIRVKHGVPLFAVCVNNAEYPASLQLHKIYRVIPDENAAQDGDIRVIDESGEDYLYPADWLVTVKLPQAYKTPSGVPVRSRPTRHWS